ncbi:hypothetical protein KTR66_03685 [Roseococcus sp. SDR]|uniref:hypothetical protein n=1 Tax=Roseococcus sp. SDR TaxID=2835532 RepID=UPI001BD0B8B9|nr:hypothetical protein [Roseococcus sp. SDR]MBS7789081.1 hypothetical protein [Roseococcus sp. SDR]MBV1844395.1 hypothetical protein [Roseococcus sp. SDR]
MATQAQKLADYREASRLFKEAQRLLHATGAAAGMLPGKRPGAPEAQPEDVKKGGGDHPLVEIAKARAAAAKHRLRPVITEVSLVDQPASPGCHVVLMKGAGHPLVKLAMARREAAR